MNNRKIWIFLIVFTLLNLSLIPLISLYGLRVCPVLSIPGFGFGCYYSALYIGLVVILNSLVIYLSKGKNRSLFFYLTIYISASVIAAFLLQYLLNLQQLSPYSKAPQILVLASLLLGIVQVYGLDWANYDSQFVSDQVSEKRVTFKKLWRFHVVRTLLPFFIGLITILHFLLNQSASFTHGNTAPPLPLDLVINEASYLIIFITFWIFITYSFYFLRERVEIKKVQTHLDELSTFNFEFSSQVFSASGIWSSILIELNLFSKALLERGKLLAGFSRFVSATVVKDAMQMDLKADIGEMQTLTVLSTDLRNFTALSEKLTPSQIVSILNDYFSEMLEVSIKYQIFIDKFIGDGILAYVDSNIKKLEEDNTLAVKAAEAMLERLELLNIKLEAKNLPKLQMGIGIHRGSLVIGLIGSKDKLQHTIIGDTVNRTARLEGLCKTLGVPVVLSKEVWDSLSPDIQKRYISFGYQEIKGIKEEVIVYGGPFKNL